MKTTQKSLNSEYNIQVHHSDKTLNSTDELIDRIRRRTAHIGIIGLGYVGLPLLWTFHEEAFQVCGFDVDEKKIDALNKGVSYIKHISADMMGKLAESDRCSATGDFSELEKMDVIIICVPTPLSEHRGPDMQYVIQTSETIAAHLQQGQLVLLESTTYPGTTAELIVPILEEATGMKAAEDFFCGLQPRTRRSRKP